MEKQLTLLKVKGAKKSTRRRVREEYREGDQVGFKTKSFTRNNGTEHHPTIDVKTGEFHCTCEHHQFTHKFCKHLKRAALQLIRKGDLLPNFLNRVGLKCCHRCGDSDRLFEMCHDDGTPMFDVFICGGCVAALGESQNAS